MTEGKQKVVADSLLFDRTDKNKNLPLASSPSGN